MDFGIWDRLSGAKRKREDAEREAKEARRKKALELQVSYLILKLF